MFQTRAEEGRRYEMPLQMAATGDLNCIKGVEKVEGKRYYVSKKGVKSILQALLLFENKIQLRIPFGYP